MRRDKSVGFSLWFVKNVKRFGLFFYLHLAFSGFWSEYERVEEGWKKGVKRVNDSSENLKKSESAHPLSTPKFNAFLNLYIERGR